MSQQARSLSPDQLEQIASHGLAVHEVERQVALLETPPLPVKVDRACTLGDGIRVIDAETGDRLARFFESRMPELGCVKFIPASGAASRMFAALSAEARASDPVSLSDLRARDDANAAEVLKLLDGIERLPFVDRLPSRDPESFDDDVRSLLQFMLGSDGLGYETLPKALIPFHREGAAALTPFEEHLVEAAEYAKGEGGLCRLHFTVSPEHLPGFESLEQRVHADFGERLDANFQIDYSVQKPSTDSIAVAEDGTLFVGDDGRLVFRPGGHGALIENLAEIDADIVFVKNIDNVAHRDRRGDGLQWKKVLAGMAVELKTHAFELIDSLKNARTEDSIAAAVDFVRRSLNIDPATLVDESGSIPSAEVLIDRLNRPLRVCGMVRNTGEPGGGPFWVRNAEGTSAQIVEASQIDLNDSEQRERLETSTHFNPVDLVCAPRAHDGSLHDLRQFIDQDTVFVVEKSKDGRPLRAIERPGLWNGAMALWNTVFVEVPVETFTPVKTVSQLLDPPHQPAG